MSRGNSYGAFEAIFQRMAGRKNKKAGPVDRVLIRDEKPHKNRADISQRTRFGLKAARGKFSNIGWSSRSGGHMKSKIGNRWRRTKG